VGDTGALRRIVDAVRAMGVWSATGPGGD